MIEVVVYLGALVLANLAAATWGPAVTIPNAVLLIGLDLTLRDRLHQRWWYEGRAGGHRWLLPLRMGLLIATAGALSYLVVPGAGPIAVASAVAWVVASIVDALVYQLLMRTGRDRAVLGSNVASAAVDSALFPTLAFGGFLPLVTLGQFVAKVAGGALWLVVLRALSQRRQAA